MKKQQSNKLRVAVLFGGQSTEHEVSLCSSLDIVRAINRQQYELILIGIDKCGRWTLCDEKNYLLNSNDPNTICLSPENRYLAFIPGQKNVQLIDVVNGQPLPSIDVAFSVLHGASGEDGSVQGLLRILNIPYASPDVLGSAICMDKDITKRVLREAGIPVTPSVTLLHANSVAEDFDLIVSQLGLPLFIKPTSQGSSIGVSKVTDRNTFNSALTLAFRYGTKVLVEQAITGREIEIAVLGNDSPEVSVCGEIIVKDEFYTYDAKYLKSTQIKLVIPPLLSPTIAAALQKMARKAYLALNCSVMARIDFFLTHRGDILLNEVNTLPGFTSVSMFPRLWKASGLDYSRLIERIITLALTRTAHFNQNKRF